MAIGPNTSNLQKISANSVLCGISVHNNNNNNNNNYYYYYYKNTNVVLLCYLVTKELGVRSKNQLRDGRCVVTSMV